MIGRSSRAAVVSSCAVIWKQPSRRRTRPSPPAVQPSRRWRRGCRTHRAETARRDEVPGLLDEQVLHRPHLVLADAGRADDVAPAVTACSASNSGCGLRGRRSWRSGGGTRRASRRSAQPGRGRGSAGLALLRDLERELAEGLWQRPHNGDVGVAELRRISAGSMSRWTTVAPGAKAESLPGDAVVEPCADRDEHVAGVHARFDHSGGACRASRRRADGSRGTRSSP